MFAHSHDEAIDAVTKNTQTVLFSMSLFFFFLFIVLF